MPETKKCCKCKIDRLLSKFHRNKLTKDGRQSMCKVCRAEYDTKYQRDNKEKRSLQRKEYNKLNRGKMKLYMIQYRRDNRDKRRAYNAKYQRDNQDILNKNRREYREKNREKIRAITKVVIPIMLINWSIRFLLRFLLIQNSPRRIV